MFRFIFALAFLGVAQPIFSAPIIWPTNGHAYEVVQVPLTWSNAYLAARSQTPPPGYGMGHLATISNAAENAFVLSLGSPSSEDSGGVWIGFTDALVEGEWFWIDNSTV